MSDLIENAGLDSQCGDPGGIAARSAPAGDALAVDWAPRWVRPAPAGLIAGEARLEGLAHENLTEILYGESRRKLLELSRLEREMESRLKERGAQDDRARREIAARWNEEAASRQRQLETEAERLFAAARKEGRDDGFREGFDKGVEEGRRLGLEKGRLEGLNRGRREEQARFQEEMTPGLRALQRACGLLADERRRLIEDARRELLHLAVEIARKVIRREVLAVDGVVLANVERAIELSVRRGSMVLYLHPKDVPVVRAVLADRPRWAEEVGVLDLRSDETIERGGCRLVAGSGAVDLTLESQLSLIEEALFGEAPHGVGRPV